MCEILIKAIDATHSDSDIDRIGCYKAGMPIIVVDDDFSWGSKECQPLFYVVKIPLINKSKVLKFIVTQVDIDNNIYRKRLWRIRVEDLPSAAKQILIDQGSITIKATNRYIGAYDYTWGQIKRYFRNLETDIDGAELDV